MWPHCQQRALAPRNSQSSVKILLHPGARQPKLIATKTDVRRSKESPHAPGRRPCRPQWIPLPDPRLDLTGPPDRLATWRVPAGRTSDSGAPHWRRRARAGQRSLPRRAIQDPQGQNLVHRRHRIRPVRSAPSSARSVAEKTPLPLRHRRPPRQTAGIRYLPSPRQSRETIHRPDRSTGQNVFPRHIDDGCPNTCATSRR